MSKVTENFELYLKATESAAIAAAKLRGNGDGKASDKVGTHRPNNATKIWFRNCSKYESTPSSTMGIVRDYPNLDERILWMAQRKAPNIVGRFMESKEV